MVRCGLCVLLMAWASVSFADERKCIVRQPDGSQEVRHIDIVKVHKAKDRLQRFLDREESGRQQEVERCIEVWRNFASPEAREVDRNSPR